MTTPLKTFQTLHHQHGMAEPRNGSSALIDYMLDQQAQIRYDAKRGDQQCLGCGGSNFIYDGPGTGEPGSRICTDCAAVDSHCNYYETMYGRCISTRTSNYKRIHHWHERVSQLLLQESTISEEHTMQIEEAFKAAGYTVANKDTIRAILRSLKMQQYIEKWLQIMVLLTGKSPPEPGPVLLMQLDTMFLQLQRAFDVCSDPQRKNFLNYNYVITRLLQKMKCHQFCMFFPLIKSKQKLANLDATWKRMMEFMGWPYEELIEVPAFSVCMPAPAHGSVQSFCEVGKAAPAVLPLKRLRMVYQTSGRSGSSKKKAIQSPLRSEPSVPQFQRLGLLRKRRRFASA